jgi:penicillin amidase
MTTDASAPTIEVKARDELWRLLLEPKLGAAQEKPAPGTLDWESYRWGMSTVWLENVLSKKPARWLPSNYPSYEALLAAAVETAIKQNGVPENLNDWKWGKVSQVDIEHPVLRHLPVIAGFTGPGEHPLAGDSYTVKAVSRRHGPSERATWNFADFDKSALNLVTGESGVFLSPYYMDEWPAWYGGATFNFPFSPRAVEQHQKHQVTLVPPK